MAQITLRGLDPEMEKAIRITARKSGESCYLRHSQQAHRFSKTKQKVSCGFIKEAGWRVE